LLLAVIDNDGIYRVFSYEEALLATGTIGTSQCFWVVDTLNRDHSFVMRIQDAVNQTFEVEQITHYEGVPVNDSFGLERRSEVLEDRYTNAI
jgi:hypothetical protein